jgi:hypothetical protein
MDTGYFLDAIRGGANMAAPASNNQALANSFLGGFRADAVEKGAQGYGAVAAQTAEDDERKRKAAEAARLKELQDQLDPTKYQKLRKDDGGFAFYDPAGNEISIDDYSKRTGQRRAELVADSENPIDQQYLHDYNQLDKVTQALYNNDQMTIQQLTQAKPDMFGGGVKPQDLMKKLAEQYPHMYGRGKYEDTLKNWGKPLFNFDVEDPETYGGGFGGGLSALAGED